VKYGLVVYCKFMQDWRATMSCELSSDVIWMWILINTLTKWKKTPIIYMVMADSEKS